MSSPRLEAFLARLESFLVAGVQRNGSNFRCGEAVALRRQFVDAGGSCVKVKLPSALLVACRCCCVAGLSKVNAAPWTMLHCSSTTMLLRGAVDDWAVAMTANRQARQNALINQVILVRFISFSWDCSGLSFDLPQRLHFVFRHQLRVNRFDIIQQLDVWIDECLIPPGIALLFCRVVADEEVLRRLQLPQVFIKTRFAIGELR
jgi:hypothetical protein